MNTTTTRAVSRWVILMLALGAGFSVASIYYAQPLLPLMGSDLHLSIEGMGMVPTLTQAGYALGILFLLPLGDRHDRRTLIQPADWHGRHHGAGYCPGRSDPRAGR